MALVLAFFIGSNLIAANPFVRTAFPPQDGRGLNPLLRHPGMIIHPPMLYAGFTGLLVPFAFCIASLITRRTDNQWLRSSRRWMLVGWVFLGAGLILGGRWAHDVLGWGGYWGWDPVENGPLIPWLVGTAFLHSAMIQEKRGMFKNWNVMLMLITFAAVVWGTAVVRSGVLTSVHAFAESDLGLLFLGFIVVVLGASLYLWLSRLDTLRSENTFDAGFSREGIFMLQNVLFLSTALTIFIGTVFPIITEAINGTKVTVGPPFFNQVAVPQMVVLVLLMGVAPLLAWRKASMEALGRMSVFPVIAAALVVAVLIATGTRQVIPLILFALCAYTFVQTILEYGRGVVARMRTVGENAPQALWHLVQRNQRRYGGYLVHLGVVLIAIGATGKGFYGTDALRNVNLNDSFTLGNYTFTYRGIQTVPCDFNDCQTVQAAVLVTSATDGHVIGGVYPHRDTYPVQQETSTIADTTGSFNEEVYVILGGWVDAGQTATFQVYLNPLINWIWLGGVVLILGFLVAFWKLEPVTVTQTMPDARVVGVPSK
jgi:cytochrome c-type biogenesis protein CcmF